MSSHYLYQTEIISEEFYIQDTLKNTSKSHNHSSYWQEANELVIGNKELEDEEGETKHIHADQYWNKPNRNYVYILYTTIVQDVYNRCIQNVSNISTNFAYILYTKLKELWHLKFVYKMYRKVCQNVGYILYTSILIYKKCAS